MTKCLQSYSLTLFNRYFVGRYRESYRLPLLENGPNGLEYCSLTNYINLFFWSGGPPASYLEPRVSQWQARGALNAGDFGGWNGPTTSQHLKQQSASSLRADRRLVPCRSVARSTVCLELLEPLHQVGKQHGKPNACPGHERSIRHVAELFPITPQKVRSACKRS